MHNNTHLYSELERTKSILISGGKKLVKLIEVAKVKMADEYRLRDSRKSCDAML